MMTIKKVNYMVVIFMVLRCNVVVMMIIMVSDIIVVVTTTSVKMT